MIREPDLPNLFFAFLNRARFRYSIGSIFNYAIRCLCLRSLDDSRRERSVKRHFLFEKAEGKFMQELDVVRIVKTLRKFKMLA
jgi:hypothetical protein